ncbi:MAG: formylmethanofuran--tetrahydromethanopterin N-formyltransferase [Planctomycetes bacterium]|nr:formylmethanofuran--tetrahydromethanopterin N-formyltransferase [Planctomycetota bacterium]
MSASASADLLSLNGVPVADTFAEAFPIVGTRAIITAVSAEWARTAAIEMAGHATSVIACDAEAALEREIPADDTPDGRPGASVLVFAFSRDKLAAAVAGRVGQCVLTCPTTACFNGLPDTPRDKRIPVGGRLRYFGDGFQISKRLGERRFWRIPVMDGEFVCEDRFGTVKGVAGGNLLICGRTQSAALAAAVTAARAMRACPDVILPFPGGIVRSGSKVGSKYKALNASTNHAFCPTLRSRTDSALPEGTGAVYEIVVDGLSSESVSHAMRGGLHAAAACEHLTLITAGNYGGRLGPHHFYLRELL